MDNDEFYNITLKCSECENTDCKYCPLGTYISGEQGCRRKITEDLYIEYLHQLKEEFPFYRQLSSKEDRDNCYIKTIDVLNKVYESEFNGKIGKSGKILKNL